MNSQPLYANLVALVLLLAATGPAFAEQAALETLYEDAFELLVQGSYGAAYDRFDEILRSYPDTPHARRAKELQRRLERLDLSQVARRAVVVGQEARVRGLVDLRGLRLRRRTPERHRQQERAAGAQPRYRS